MRCVIFFGIVVLLVVVFVLCIFFLRILVGIMRGLGSPGGRSCGGEGGLLSSSSFCDCCRPWW